MNFVAQHMSKMTFHTLQNTEESVHMEFFAPKPGMLKGTSRAPQAAPLPVDPTKTKVEAVADHERSLNALHGHASTFPIESQQPVPQNLPQQFTLPFHNPFDFNSYPMTNPPLFDSTMMVPYTLSDGVPRRRRLSISNGQIGQITNHEASLDTRANENNDRTSGTIRPGSVAPLDRSDFPLEVQQPTPDGDGATPVNAAGVPPPNHLLIYNNEVIFNPNDGPIPGTAAWKRERLLERNRIAASKCRQRKKQAQQNLQESISKYEKLLEESEHQVERYQVLVTKFKEVIKQTIDSKGADLSALEQLLTASVNNVML